MFIIGIIVFIINIFAIIHLIDNKSYDGMMKIFWLILIFCIPIVGALLYLAVAKQS